MRRVGPRVDDLSCGGKNNRVHTLTGIHHVTMPTSDPVASSDWYERILGFTTLLIEEHENDVVAVLLQHPCGARLLLRGADVQRAALRGYPLFALSVASHTELLHWVEHLTTLDVDHGAVHQAHLGWAVTITGPDLLEIQIRTDEGPSGDDE
jgi:catechol 2,3-dioxygenase-like lactoylglutathione lyase family enzyme